MSLKKMIPFLFGTTILASGAISLAASSTNLASSSVEQMNFVTQTNSLLEDSVNKKQDILLDTIKKEKLIKDLEKSQPVVSQDEDSMAKVLSAVKSLISSDKNYYKWYYLYHIIGLSNEVLKVIDEYYSDGVSAIVGIISYLIPAFAPFAAPLALALNFEWSYWELSKFANEGKDVELKCLGGVVPQVIISVSEQ